MVDLRQTGRIVLVGVFLGCGIQACSALVEAECDLVLCLLGDDGEQLMRVGYRNFLPPPVVQLASDQSGDHTTHGTVTDPARVGGMLAVPVFSFPGASFFERDFFDGVGACFFVSRASSRHE